MRTESKTSLFLETTLFSLYKSFHLFCCGVSLNRVYNQRQMLEGIGGKMCFKKHKIKRHVTQVAMPWVETGEK